MMFDVTRTWHGVEARNGQHALEQTRDTQHDAFSAGPALPRSLDPGPPGVETGPSRGECVWSIACVRLSEPPALAHFTRITPGQWCLRFRSTYLMVRMGRGNNRSGGTV